MYVKPDFNNKEEMLKAIVAGARVTVEGDTPKNGIHTVVGGQTLSNLNHWFARVEIKGGKIIKVMYPKDMKKFGNQKGVNYG